MATIRVLGSHGTSALIWKCNRVIYRKKSTTFIAFDDGAHWSTGFGFDEPVVINNDRSLRQPEYETLTFRGHAAFEVLSGKILVEAV